LNVGESLSVECEGFGDPPPTQYWLRKMGKISGPVLHVRNASHSDHGLYQCILSNAIVSSVRNFTLTVRNTAPQCPEEAKISCLGEDGLRLDFIPGYNGGHEQMYRLFYANIEKLDDELRVADSFHDPVVVMEDLERFAKYRFVLETSNILGAVNCTIGERHSKLALIGYN
jgi:hypothetical protein